MPETPPTGSPESLTVWAPAAHVVRAVIDRSTRDATPMGAGWWRVHAAVRHGIDYGFLLDDDPRPLPDPRSTWQPQGVHGLSRVYDHSRFAWSDEGWRGVPLAGAVFYELHVGTFTPAGTYFSV